MGDQPGVRGAEMRLPGELAVVHRSASVEIGAARGGDERAVGFEVLDLLSRLVDKSLVEADETSDGDVCYRLTPLGSSPPARRCRCAPALTCRAGEGAPATPAAPQPADGAGASEPRGAEAPSAGR